MSEECFKIRKKGLTLLLFPDCVENPRSYDRDDNIGTMVCFHPRIDLGDEHNFANEQEFLDWADKNKDEIVCILPIHCYDDEKVSISTEQDGIRTHYYGQIGYIYCTKQRLKDCWWARDDGDYEWVKDHLDEEVMKYDDWLNNYPPYYSFEIKDSNKNCLHLQGIFEYYDFKDMIDEMKERNEKKEYNYLFDALLKREMNNCL